MKIISDIMTVSELREIAHHLFGEMVKAVVDVEREVIAVDAELHSDLEAALLQDGSKQKSLWGVNLYPDMYGSEFIEFDSMINVRPSQGNRSRGVDDEKVHAQIIAVVSKRVKP